MELLTSASTNRWYWGDAFFMSLQNLVFDGVFEVSLVAHMTYDFSLKVGLHTRTSVCTASHVLGWLRRRVTVKRQKS